MKKLSVLLVFVLTLTMALSFSALAYQGNESFGDAPIASEKIDVDGVKDDAYAQGVHIVLDRYLWAEYGQISNGSGEAWVVWKGDFLYLFIDVTDPDINDPAPEAEQEAPWDYDSCEIFLDFGNDGSDIWQYRIGISGLPSIWRAETTQGERVAVGADECGGYFGWGTTTTDYGYTTEFKIPLEDAEIGDEIGLQLQINDNYFSYGHNERKLSPIMSQSSIPAKSWEPTNYDYIVLGDEAKTPVATDPEALAEDLKTLGLFIGTENGFELDRAPTRIEALVMLIRLLGVENDAKNGTWSHPFTDVPDWAAPYVGYAYEKGLTAGVSDTLFGTDELSNAAQYLTFVLRALGYSDADGDFVWNKSNEKAAEIGLIGADDYPDLENGEFLRADTVIISYSALSVNMKDTETTLVASLIDKGAVDADLAADLGLTK